MNDRKQRVLLTAKKLFIDKGFTATSVQDILDEAGISKGTFYNYFSSKNECLMAILTHIQDLVSAKREELIGKGNQADQSIFAKQISVRMQMNREQRLIPLFEAVFHSGDQELRNFIKRHHLAELAWLKSRIIDVYGKEATPYALDIAIIMLGMIQHFANVWVSCGYDELDTDELVLFVLRRTDAIAADMMESDDRLFSNRIFLPIEKDTNESFTKEEIVGKLATISKSLSEDHPYKQHIDFILEELSEPRPRMYLLQTIVSSLQELFKDSPMATDIRHLTFNIKNYLQSLNRKDK